MRVTSFLSLVALPLLVSASTIPVEDAAIAVRQTDDGCTAGTPGTPGAPGTTGGSGVPGTPGQQGRDAQPDIIDRKNYSGEGVLTCSPVQELPVPQAREAAERQAPLEHLAPADLQVRYRSTCFLH